MNILLRYLLLANLILFVGCANTNFIPQKKLDQVTRIGVVSQTADTLHKQYVGMTVFNNVKDPQDISEWMINEIYENQLSDAIVDVLGTEVVNLGRYRSKFSEVNNYDGPWSAEAFWGPSFGLIKDITIEMCKKYNLDIIAVVARYQSLDSFNYTNQKIEGVGVYSRHRVSEGNIYLLADIGFMDCVTGKELARSRLRNSDKWYISKPLEFDLATKPYENWTTQERNRLKSVIVSLPEKSWKTSIRDILPAGGEEAK